MTAGESVVAVPTLLGTKLHAPRPRRGVVARPRLTDRLAGPALPAVTVVAAPAGFGKTTLLAESCATNEAGACRLAWLSLDGSDNDPTVFWSYVIAAIQTAVAGAGADALALLRQDQPAESVVASLLNDLTELGDDLVIVLDDYHAIDSVPIHEAIAFAVEHLPHHVHLVLGTRADPPLPLARWRARGDLLELRASDLRFSPDESAAYLNQQMGLDLGPADVDALDGRTEGWIAALQLAALSLQGRDDTSGFIASFTGDDRFVVDYLAEEVLERQPDDVRTFLLETAVMDRFNGSLCDAVTGRDDGKAMLERLDRANLFLVPLDDRRQWYRYHHLFADVLRARLLDDDPGRVDDLHRRASAWYEATGDQPEAIAHALVGHDVEGAARLIELAAPTMFQTRQEWTARRWLSALPAALFPDRPVLSIELVGALMVSGEIAGVEPLLDSIDRWLAPDVDSTQAIVFDHAYFARLPAQVAVYHAALSLIAGDPDATIEHASRALDLVAPSDHLQRGSAEALVGLAEWTKGNLDEATHHYGAAIAALTAAGHISDVLGCAIALADIHLVQGRLRDAQQVFESGLELASSHKVVRGTGDMHVGLSEVLLERNDLDGAKEHLDANTRLGDDAGLPQNAYRWRVAAARVHQAERDLATAVRLLGEAERAYNTDMSPPVRPPAAVKVRAQLAAGDLAAARRWADSSGLTVDDELTYVREYEHLALAHILLAAGAVDDAARLSSRLLAAAEQGQRTRSVIEALIVLALAEDARGDRASATEHVRDALDRAAPERWVRVFADALPAMAPLLRAASTPGISHDLAQEVLVTTGPGNRVAAATPGQDLVDPLSGRELDVLRMLRSDLSGPEIARELHVSLNTFRTHTKNIYAKLGARNRREAVRRAAELGL